MDVELSTTQPQVQPVGRGDRVARTREAIVSSTLTLAMALTPESWIVLRERLGLTVDQARDEWRFIVKAIFNGR